MYSTFYIKTCRYLPRTISLLNRERNIISVNLSAAGSLGQTDTHADNNLLDKAAYKFSYPPTADSIYNKKPFYTILFPIQHK